jgi:hypothetical protein
MVRITDNDYLGSAKILWEWLELQPMTTGISEDTLGMIGITANDYLGSVANIWAMLVVGMGTIGRPITWNTPLLASSQLFQPLAPLIVAVFCI